MQEKPPPLPALVMEQMRFEEVSFKIEKSSKIRGAAERHSWTQESDTVN